MAHLGAYESDEINYEGSVRASPFFMLVYTFFCNRAYELQLNLVSI